MVQSGRGLVTNCGGGGEGLQRLGGGGGTRAVLPLRKGGGDNKSFSYAEVGGHKTF